MIKKNKKWLLLITSLLVIFYSCGSAAPFKQKQLAEVKIQEAKDVEAESYAPIELSNSQENYNSGEALIEPDKKSGKNKEALNEYLSAIKNAETAYDKSIAPYTKTFIDGLAGEIESARQEKADVASKELFDSALSDFNSANDKYNEKDFLPAIDDVRSSEEKIREAVENTRSLKEQTTKQDRDIEKLIEEAKKRKALAATPNEYNESLDDFNKIQQQNQAGNYPKSLEEYPGLKNKFQNMFTTIDDLRNKTAAEDNNIKALIEQAKRRKASIVTPNEYKQNVNTFNKIQRQNQAGNYSQSLREYPGLKNKFQVMLATIDDLRNKTIAEDNNIKALIEEAKKRKALAATPNEYQKNLDTFSTIQRQNREGYYARSLQQYPNLKKNFQVMFSIIEEKRLLAAKEIKEAEQKIEQVTEKNQGLEEEISTLN